MEKALRCGIHCGPVTGGVLRGERSRFQLFGDTMNTASRMESTGLGNHIQVSEEAADQLSIAGKGHWVRLRDEQVTAKGKGQLRTYFLTTGPTSTTRGSLRDIQPMNRLSSPSAHAQTGPLRSETTDRLIQWHVEVLLRFIPKIMARAKRLSRTNTAAGDVEGRLDPRGSRVMTSAEVQEIVPMSGFEQMQPGRSLEDSEGIAVPQNVEEQLHGYIAAIASLYHGTKREARDFSHDVTWVLTLLLLFTL
jgi:Adenylate and Guanylate cyclase catalytic domain